MDERCARASRVRDLTDRLSALAVLAAVTLAAGPTVRILGEPSATERPSFSATARPSTCPGGQQGGCASPEFGIRFVESI
jgi:hypothetical protein